MAATPSPNRFLLKKPIIIRQIHCKKHAIYVNDFNNSDCWFFDSSNLNKKVKILHLTNVKLVENENYLIAPVAFMLITILKF